MKRGMMKEIAALVVIILGVLVVFALQPAPSAQPVSQEEAVQFVMADLKDFLAQGADVRVADARKAGGKWEVDVFISENPHSKCPTLYERFYALVPFQFRFEPLVSDCGYKKPIIYREEALITSAKSATVNSFISSDPQAYGCAFKALGFDEAAATQYCPLADSAKLREFSDGLGSDDWMVLWVASRESRLYAFNPVGGLIKTG